MSNQNTKVEVGFIWQITDYVLRDTFKKNEIGDVVLPFVVLRRLDCILEPVNQKVRDNFNRFHDKLSEEKLIPVLRKASGGLKFYNTSKHTLHSLKDEPQYIEINFNNYLNGFNPEVREILESFQFGKIIARLSKNRLLYEMIDAICKIDLDTKAVDNHGMGYVFEELIRISNEQSNETAGEHFTPRDVIGIMNAFLFAGEKENLTKPGIIRTIYDCACGTGGMVNLGKKYIQSEVCKDSEHKPTIVTYGQELNEQSYAIAKSESLITGEDANNIKLGNTFSQDQFPDKKFHYMMANPPYGVTWKKDKSFIENEALNPVGRFYAGTPRVSDGQLLFIQHMISKMEREGSRIGVVTNGSPLFTGSAGSGESEIRRWIIENDWLECIVSLPKDLFYNTGINTYIWFLTNKKDKKRKGKIQLIDGNATETMTVNGKEKQSHLFCQPNKKSLGNKRNEISSEHIGQLLELYTNFEESTHSKIFDNEYFGYYELTIEQPEMSVLEVNDLKEAFNCFKKPELKDKSPSQLLALLEEIEHFKREAEYGTFIHATPVTLDAEGNLKIVKDTSKLDPAILEGIPAKEIYDDYTAKLSKKDIKEIEAFLKKARKPDSKKRDKENVPLNADVDQYFKNEVLPHVPDAWIDYDKTRIGYELNFTKYFYQYKPLRAANEVKTEIVDLEKKYQGPFKRFDLINMKRYEKYKETNLMWYPEIPNGWKICKVKHVAKTYAGGTPSTVKTEYWDKGNIPWLPSGKLQNGEISSAEKFITKEGLDRSSTKWIKENTVLVALTGATCANIGYLKFKACANQSVVAIDEFKDKTNSRFLYYIFLNMRKQILTHQTGGAQAGINDGNVKNLYLTLPSLSEQIQIAAYLDYKTGLIDAIIAQKEELIKKLKEQRQAIINEAVTKGLNPNAKMKDSGIEWLGEVPEHWKVVRIGHYVNIFRGASPRPAGDSTLFKGDFLPWITVGEVANGNSKYLKSTKYFLTELGSRQSRVVHPETLLLSNSGATLGVPKITLIKGCINDGSVAFESFNSKLDRDYLYHFFMTHTKTYREEMAGYGQPNLNTDIIKSTKIPLPPIEEQFEIIEFIEKSQDNSFQIIKKSQLSIQKLKEYRQSLISEAVTGKIDVRNWQAPKS